MKDKKTLLIIITVVALIILGVFFLFKKGTITFTLNGDSLIEINYGEEFNDPGFIAKDRDGNSINDKVVIYGSVNSNASGDYKIVYELKYNGDVQKLERVVRVRAITIDDFEIKLNGNEEVYLLKDDNYVERGATIYYKSNQSIYSNADYVVNSNINNSIIGKYDVTYSFNYDGQTISVTRKVNVIDFDYSLTPNEMTNGKVTITLDLNGIGDYAYTRLPNGYTNLNKEVSYDVESNGDYTFTIILNNKEELKKNVTVNNIAGNLSCNGVMNVGGTKISVTPVSSDVKEFEWSIDGKIVTGGSIYTANKVVNSAKVNLIYNSGRKYELSCNISDNLVYHFKYDENNTKPFMKCNTYTAQDKIKYDNMLKQVITIAGYGTRAGVVAAARFLVGGLDYKVPYLGPKTVDKSLGRYPKTGLNIGQQGAWGCKVSGWTQGMDCTNFVSWAFYQNGIHANVYSTNYSKVRDVMNKIKVGDLLYTPCKSNCKNDFKLNHVGIIIGIDEKYFYVAESTSGSINAIIVTKVEKSSIKDSGNFSAVNLFKYKSDGYLTDMWM